VPPIAGPLWGTWDAGAPSDVARTAFRRRSLCTLCWPPAMAGPFGLRSLDSGPNVDGVAGRISKKVSYCLAWDAPAGLLPCTKGPPRSWAGVAFREGFGPRGGRWHFRAQRGPAGFRKGAACFGLTTRFWPRSMGPWDSHPRFFPQRRRPGRFCMER